MNRNFRALSTLSPTHVDQLVDMYQSERWTRGRIRSDVATMLQGSDVVFAYEDDEGKICAFAPAITDGVFKAMIFDVIVRKGLRGSRLGARILQDVREHPVLSRVRHVELYCLPELQDPETWSLCVKMARSAGIEPTTPGFGGQYSIH
jgi:hypothetical protein